MRKSKKQAKKEGRIFIDPTKERKELTRDINQLIKQTNKNLRSLNKKGFYNSFSSKKLFERLRGKVNALMKENKRTRTMYYS